MAQKTALKFEKVTDASASVALALQILTAGLEGNTLSHMHGTTAGGLETLVLVATGELSVEVAEVLSKAFKFTGSK